MVLLDVFTHVGRESWCIRVPCRAPVAAILRWATALAGTIGDPSRKCVGLHVLHAGPVHTELGCHERYWTVGHGDPRVSWSPPQTASQTASQRVFSHCLINHI